MKSIFLVKRLVFVLVSFSLMLFGCAKKSEKNDFKREIIQEYLIAHYETWEEVNSMYKVPNLKFKLGDVVKLNSRLNFSPLDKIDEKGNINLDDILVLEFGAEIKILREEENYYNVEILDSGIQGSCLKVDINNAQYGLANRVGCEERLRVFEEKFDLRTKLIFKKYNLDGNQIKEMINSEPAGRSVR
ncbi:MAG: hypothetical protein R8N23_13675 [Reichenbachiella sp.]|uniref:hypothetical protein n=1 Tax=Reichenbachiella sp. TaxID=2184521 RepID=UPI002965DE25|nr:hypothetical protein [Reichenbachiella sp.]MDW3210920.1 hypothetical protein [Reichenbachiella sp.]